MANVAVHKPCEQSSTFLDFVASFAVDGSKDSNLRHGHCTHSNKYYNSWWRVDLLDQYLVQWVEIANRQDIARESFSITALNTI